MEGKEIKMSRGRECDFCDNSENDVVTKCSEDCYMFICKYCTQDCEDCSSKSLCQDCYRDHERTHADEIYYDYMVEEARGMDMYRCSACGDFFHEDVFKKHVNECWT